MTTETTAKCNFEGKCDPCVLSDDHEEYRVQHRHRHLPTCTLGVVNLEPFTGCETTHVTHVSHIMSILTRGLLSIQNIDSYTIH
ncbi:hypothetical protein J6590_076202 [Homalodisca vitripennis]|nr:hypothetical protein J6590_076202 [Homalodisca vitripennis]